MRSTQLFARMALKPGEHVLYRRAVASLIAEEQMMAMQVASSQKGA